MFKHKFYGVAIATSLVAGLSSCESIVDDINNDPNAFTDITLQLALNQAQLNMASISGAFPAHVATMWTDQFTGTDRQYITYDQYGIANNDFDDVWLDLYQRGIVQAQEAKAQAAAQGLPVLQGIALVTEGYYFGEAASMFGDVPFNEANKVTEFTDPNYQAQGEVLRGAVALIDEALPLLGTATVAGISSNIFATQGATWAQIANGLKARYLLGLMDYEGAYAAAAASGITMPRQDLAVKSSTTNFGENLWWQFEIEQRTTYLTVGNTAQGLSYFQQLLTDSTTISRSRGDAKTNDAGRYAYYIDVNGTPAKGVSYNTTNGWAAQTAKTSIITAAEVQLILAEAAARTGRRDEAIKGLNAGRNYYDELLGQDNYKDFTSDDLDSDTDGDAFIKRILVEKFLGVIGLPTFYDLNRTKNLIGTTSENNLPLAKRFFYPSTEQSSNDNFPGLKPLVEPLPLYK